MQILSRHDPIPESQNQPASAPLLNKEWQLHIAVFFYALLKPVNKTLALIAAAFRLTQAAILGLNLLNYYGALLLLTSTGYAVVFETDQLHALAMLLLDLHSHGYDLGLLFFGLSNLILGYLIIKSEYFPGILG